jgi:ribonuclease BN (tRNA processing enzyme)
VKVVVLGSGGWIPTRSRETCSLLVRTERAALVVDAGTGIRHLVERPDLLEGCDSVDLLLTHFHLDHVVGLSYVPALRLGERLTVWGPGEALYGRSTEDVLGQLLGRPLFSTDISSMARTIREVDEGTIECAGTTVHMRRQEGHTDPTLAFRCEDRVTYCTDTAFDPDNAVFAQGSAVLLHEAWHVGRHPDERIHTSAEDAARVAETAEAEQLVLIHVNPLLEDEESLVAAARGRFENTVVGTDLLAVDG